VLAAARRLLHLVTDLLELARVDSGQLTLTPTHFALAPLLKQVCESRSAECRIVFEQDVGAVYCDQAKLSRCVLELLGEVERLREQGPVQLRVCCPPGRDRLELSFRAQVAKVSAGGLAFMLNPLAPVERAGADRPSELGLAVVRRLAEFMGGGLNAHLEPGEVMVLTLQLPLGPAGAEVGLSTESAAGPHVLVVDDEAAARDLVLRAVEPLNVAVRTAATVRAAMEQLEAAPSCVILDIMLPDGSGWDVLQAMRADPKRAHIPVLVHTIVDEAEHALRLGADGFMLKPVGRAALQLAVRDVMRAGRRRVA
jgi:CheY-like chemotaxis protein